MIQSNNTNRQPSRQDREQISQISILNETNSDSLNKKINSMPNTSNLESRRTLEDASLFVENLQEDDYRLSDINRSLERTSISMWWNDWLQFDQRMSRLSSEKIDSSIKWKDSRFDKLHWAEESYDKTIELVSELLRQVDNALESVNNARYDKNKLVSIEDFYSSKQLRDSVKQIDLIRHGLLREWLNVWDKTRLIRFAPKNEWYATYITRKLFRVFWNTLRVLTWMEWKSNDNWSRSVFGYLLWKLDFKGLSWHSKREELIKQLKMISEEWRKMLVALWEEKKAINQSINTYRWNVEENILWSIRPANEEYYGQIKKTG